MSLIIPDISYLGELWTSADLIHSTTLCYDTQKPSRPFIYPWIRKITTFTKCVKRCWLTDQPSLASQGPTGGGFQIGYALCCNVLKIGYGFIERVKEKTFGSDRILDLISGVEEEKYLTHGFSVNTIHGHPLGMCTAPEPLNSILWPSDHLFSFFCGFYAEHCCHLCVRGPGAGQSI